MDEMENKINTILSDPEMMQKIMSMASALGGQPPPSQPQSSQSAPPQPEPSPLGNIDAATIQKIIDLAQQSKIDKREQALLRALGAYLSRERIGKLEKAMRAAKIAKIASTVIDRRGVPFLAGR